MERTLILIKPDALQRGLVGEVTKRFEQKGLKLVAMKMMKLSDATIEEHYAHLVDKPFFPGIKKFMSSTPVIAQIWEGFECVDAVRLVCGVTNAREAKGGTIRGDFSMSYQNNVIHASDTSENAEIEVKRFFEEGEIFDYEKTVYQHIYDENERKG